MRRLPKVLNKAESAALLGAAPGCRPSTDPRNELMIKVMLNCGLRSAELVALKVKHIDFKEGSLFVEQGKGGKDRVVYPSKTTLRWLKQFIGKKKPDEWIFQTRNGTPVQTRYLRKMIRRLQFKAKIDKRVHPHLLRHTCATNMYRMTRNIRLVQKALGHSDIQTTQIYTEVFDADLKKAMRAL